MVTVVLRGGLGNQMFQYVAGLNAALKNKTELILDTTFLNDRFPRKEFTFRTYDLDIFDFKPRLTVLSKISNTFPIPGLWLGLDLVEAKLGSVVRLKKFVQERRDFYFEPSIFDCGSNITLWGRWQVWRYLEGIEEEVKRQFQFKHVLEGEAADIGRTMATVNSVAVHVRRGDYVAFQSVKGVMGDTNVSYYNDAIAYIAERVKNPHFFLFSDDIEWCEKNIPIKFPVTYVKNSASGPKFSFHLQLMSLAKHNIIANSTFSWWGAWLNGTSGKIVIAPKEWNQSINSSGAEIVPPDWIKL